MYTQLTYQDRIRISVFKQAGKTPTEISDLIGKHRSSIYRELGRNSSDGAYFPETANMTAINRKVEAAAIPRIDEEQKKWVVQKLLLQWSPEQISSRMKLEREQSVSHEWIYQMIYADRKAGGMLHFNLRWGRKTRKKRGGGGRDKRGQIPNRVSIEQRPEIINNRGRIGDFEGDLIIGANHKAMLLTLVDRKSRYTLIEKLFNKTAELTASATIGALHGLGGDQFSVTFDNGKEFSGHEHIAKKANVSIYFAHP